MGNTVSRKVNGSEKSNNRTNKVFFLLHRTWAIIVTDKWNKTRWTRSSNCNDYASELDSQYSFCSCSQCYRGDAVSSNCVSDILETGAKMAPNSEERGRMEFSWNEDTIAKEKQRPPLYNPEDYALSLRKWGRRPPANGPGLYSSNNTLVETEGTRTKSHSFRDYRNPMLSESEMTLRQFGTVSELLYKLKSDLKLSYVSFVQEFIADPLDGANLLLDLLRIIQLSLANNGNSSNTGTAGKVPPSVQRRALLDELGCLQCLLCCSLRYSEALRKITGCSAGLFTLSVCIMSNVTKSRIIALQLLTKICVLTDHGHSAVSEALSTLRLRFGEPVRFRFLVGMLTSTGGQGELLSTGLKFLNAFLDSAGSTQKRLYVQAELLQAGLQIEIVKKNVSINSASADNIFKELDHWEKKHIDVETLTSKLDSAERENDNLRDKVVLLERKIQILQEEKGILMSLEQCLKERCSELQDEVVSLKSGKHSKRSNNSSQKRDRSTLAEDEGISSSERSLTPEDDIQRDTSIYEVYSLQSETRIINQENNAKTDIIKSPDEKEEETTIEEVMEELNNIINNAETEAYIKEREEKQKKSLEEKNRIKIEKAQIKSQTQLRINRDRLLEDSVFDNESEIIPSNLHPQPPRKTKSLVHLYVPSEDYDCPKKIFFENETAFTSEESSDSLLSASKCLPKEAKSAPTDNLNNNRAILNTIMNARERNLHIKRRQRKPDTKSTMKRSESFRYPNINTQTIEIKHFENVKPEAVTHFGQTPTSHVHQRRSLQRSSSHIHSQRIKSKSLDRIDDGLDAMVDIVVTNNDDHTPLRTKSDSGNVTATTLSRSTSNIFGNQRVSRCLNQQNAERNKMFLPAHRLENLSSNETHYYFPRVQEKKSTSSSFLVKRGHGNAGLYSGYIMPRDSISVAKKTEYFASIGSKHSSGKVTDLPSGLY